MARRTEYSSWFRSPITTLVGSFKRSANTQEDRENDIGHMLKHFNSKHTASMQLIALQLVRRSCLFEVQKAMVRLEKIVVKAANVSRLLSPKTLTLPEQ